MNDPSGPSPAHALPRSQALVRLDGPGHIMPVEPVTPADSRAWRIVHLPVVLAAIATGALLLTAVAVRLLGPGFAGRVPGGRFALLLAGAAAIAWAYWAFGRFVERRPRLEELSRPGAVRELGSAYLAGLGIPLASFTLLRLAGALHVAGLNPLRTLLTPLVVQACLAAALALVTCGLAFRLVERWLGSWLTAALAALAFAGAHLAVGEEAPADLLAAALSALVLIAGPFMATRRLWGPIGLRAGLAFGAIALNGSASSARGPQGLVLATVIGPDWLTGGSAGPEASIPALGIDALVAILLLAVALRRGRVVRPAWRRGRSPDRRR